MSRADMISEIDIRWNDVTDVSDYLVDSLIRIGF
jgi:hypothetical protein